MVAVVGVCDDPCRDCKMEVVLSKRKEVHFVLFCGLLLLFLLNRVMNVVPSLGLLSHRSMGYFAHWVRCVDRPHSTVRAWP